MRRRVTCSASIISANPRAAWRRRALFLGALLGISLAAAPAPAAPRGVSAQAVVSLRAQQRAQERLLNGHLLRRLGFGPNRREMHEVLRLGRAAYLEQQLHPQAIDDRLGERAFVPEPGPRGAGLDWELRWMTRMAFSRRQLQEKMVLLWHEHFAISYLKIKYSVSMRDYERLLRQHALGSFRDLLIGVTIDNAMLIFLDNNGNDGQAVDDNGQPVPPNENYARELLQLFSLGPNRLHMDGTPVLDSHGEPVPAYSEQDVKEIARALTGWVAHRPDTEADGDPTLYMAPADFRPEAHDPDAKLVLGEVVEPNPQDPLADVERVADIIMAQPTTAPFIAKELLQKLATETPSPAYVQRVATVFAGSGGDLRATVRAIFADSEFYSPALVRTQYKTPIEHVVGALRGLGAAGGRGRTLQYWATQGGQRPFNPPSVFSYYRPGRKDALVTTSYAAVRDQASDMLTAGARDVSIDAFWDAESMIRRRRLRLQPERAVDLLAQDLLAAPLSPALRSVVLDYVGDEVTVRRLRGAAWLIMASPEYQVN